MPAPTLDAAQEPIELAVPDSIGSLAWIPARRLAIGMFVAELDRPWTDTPLPDAGLLIESDAHLEALREHCREVLVDARLSDIRAVGQILAAASAGDDGPAAGAPTGNVPAGIEAGWRRRGSPARNDVRLPLGGRDRVRQIAGLLEDGRLPGGGPGSLAGASPAGGERLLQRWLSRIAGRPAVPARLAPGDRHDAGDPSAAAFRWPDPSTLGDSLPAIRPAFLRVAQDLSTVLAAPRQGRTLDVAAILAAADAVVSIVIACPDAGRWLAAVHSSRAGRWEPAIVDALLLAEFGRHLGMPRESLLELATIGLLADIGKSLLPRDLLEHPGVLNAVDFALVKQHVSIALDLLERAGGVPPNAMRGIAEHHERLDGTGYPAGLEGSAIGQFGRMAAIVDTYAALTTSRPYANALSAEDALAALLGWSGRLFCRELVERFVAMVGPFPVGSLVELSSGEVAAVVDRSPGAFMRPRLVVLTGPDKGPLRGDPTGERGPDEIYRGLRVRISRGLPAGAYGLQLRDYHLLAI